MAELRSFIFLDQLQPQTMCYLGTWVRGRLPRLNVAAQVIEIAPGLDIEPLTDVALKEAESRRASWSSSGSSVTCCCTAAPPRSRPRAAPCSDALGVDATSATTPKVLASRTITSVDAQHAFLVNRNKLGSMVLPGESLFVLELQPASYAILATNEAEKAAQIKLVDYRMIGATGGSTCPAARTTCSRPPRPSPRCSASRMSAMNAAELAPAGPGGAARPAARAAAAAAARPAADASAGPARRRVGAARRPPTGACPGCGASRGRRPRSGPARAAEHVDVRISTDEDLHAFALRVLKLADNPKLRRDLISGRARFRLRRAAPRRQRRWPAVPTGVPGPGRRARRRAPGGQGRRHRAGRHRPQPARAPAWCSGRAPC